MPMLNTGIGIKLEKSLLDLLSYSTTIFGENP
jgi:hypothetical protein